MLHAIKTPPCSAHLDWIVQLQHRLFTALCLETVTANDVSVDWVIALAPELDPHWITKFCNSTDKITNLGLPLLTHMQCIARLDNETKQKLINSFEHDLQFFEAVETNRSHEHHLKGITNIDDAQIKKSVRGFFESFYNPNLYKTHAYIIPQSNNMTLQFHKDIFIDEFKRVNEAVGVCPFCDGSPNQPQVDHFYPKSRYPFFACHPLNLVPVCNVCNMASHKGQKVPLTLDALDPVQDWFHPYLRPVASWCEHDKHPTREYFRVAFVRDGKQTVARLYSDDPAIQNRLRNLNELIRLEETWTLNLVNVINATIRKIMLKVKTLNRSLTREELKELLHVWAANVKVEIGYTVQAILEYYYLETAATEDPLLFDELWVKNSGADPVHLGQ